MELTPNFYYMKEELSLIAVIVILFIADLFTCPDAHKACRLA